MDVGPITKRPKARATPYSKPILLTTDRQSRTRKSLKWQSDEKIQKVHYFELIEDERINVTRYNVDNTQNDTNAAGGSSLNNKIIDSEGGKISNANVDPIRRPNGRVDSAGKHPIEYSPWRLIQIDIAPKLPSPGWNSSERKAQAEREQYVLGAIDLPGQPSTLDEPDQQPKTTTSSNNGNNNNTSTNNDSSTAKDDASNIKTIPLDNPEGSYTEYNDMYNSEVVNGVRVPTDNPQPVVPSLSSFCDQQQSQMLTGQMPQQQPQQMVNAGPNPFAMQDLGAQYQQQAQSMPLQFPFQQPQSQGQSFQAPNMPFLDSQQQRHQLQPNQPPQPQQTLQPQAQQQQLAPFDPQLGLTGPMMPWLSYPFNQVNENSHAHLFQRPAT